MEENLRPARASELEEVAALYQAVWRETQARLQPQAVVQYRTAAYFRERLDGLPQPPVIAVDGGRLVGFAGWKGDLLDQLYLLKDIRGRGLGTRLLAIAEKAIRRDGFDRARLVCLVGNEAGRRFYERHGWAVSETSSEPAQTASGTAPVACWRMVKLL